MGPIPFKTPLTAICCGPTSCGKSTFIFKLLRMRELMFDQKFEQIIYSLPPNQQIFMPEDIKNDPKITIFKGLPNFEDFDDKKPRLLIIDDQASDCGSDISQLFTRGSHHFNVSVIVLAQNVFTANPHFRTMSLNSHYIVVFKNPRGKDQMAALARQVCPGNYKFFLEAYEDSCSAPHSYLLLDMTQSCPEELRFRTKIFPDDENCTTVYIPAKNSKK